MQLHPLYQYGVFLAFIANYRVHSFRCASIHNPYNSIIVQTQGLQMKQVFSPLNRLTHFGMQIQAPTIHRIQTHRAQVYLFVYEILPAELIVGERFSTQP